MPGLAMNYSCDAVQEVTELYMEVRDARAATWITVPTSWCATPSFGAHLAGDSVLAMKVTRRILK